MRRSPTSCSRRQRRSVASLVLLAALCCGRGGWTCGSWTECAVSCWWCRRGVRTCTAVGTCRASRSGRRAERAASRGWVRRRCEGSINHACEPGERDSVSSFTASTISGWTRCGAGCHLSTESARALVLESLLLLWTMESPPYGTHTDAAKCRVPCSVACSRDATRGWRMARPMTSASLDYISKSYTAAARQLYAIQPPAMCKRARGWAGAPRGLHISISLSFCACVD